MASRSEQALQSLITPLSPAKRSALRVGQSVVTGQAENWTGWVLINSSPALVWEVLTDYANIAEFLPHIAASRVLSSDRNRTVVEQIDVRQILFTEIESRLCLENLEYPTNRIEFRLLDGDLEKLQGCWQLHPISGTEPQVLAIQEVCARPKFAALAKLFQPLFESSLQQNLEAVRQEVERRSIALFTSARA